MAYKLRSQMARARVYYIAKIDTHKKKEKNYFV